MVEVSQEVMVGILAVMFALAIATLAVTLHANYLSAPRSSSTFGGLSFTTGPPLPFGSAFGFNPAYPVTIRGYTPVVVPQGR